MDIIRILRLILYNTAIFLCLYLLASCGRSKHEKVEMGNFHTVEVSFDPVADYNTFYRPFVRDMDVIPLENFNSIELGNVMYFKVLDTLIYILQDNRPIYVFNTHGKFRRKIGELGEGPGKFEIISDFFIEDSIIYISSYTSVEMFKLDGTYLGNFNINERYKPPRPLFNFNFFRKDGYIYLFDNGRHGKYHFYTFNEDGQLLATKFPNNYLIEAVWSRFINTEGKVYLLPVNCVDTIFQLNGAEVLPAWYFDFGSHANRSLDDLPGSMSQPQDMLNLMQYCAEKKRVFSISRFDKYKQHLFFTFGLNNEGYNCYYDTITHICSTIKYTDPPEIFNPLVNAQGFYINEGKLYMSVNAFVLKEALESGQNKCSYLSEDRQKQIMSKLKNIGELDNPVLFVVDLK